MTKSTKQIEGLSEVYGEMTEMIASFYLASHAVVFRRARLGMKNVLP